MTSEKSTIKYFGWSCFELAFGNQKLYFDPMSRKYCGVQWTKLEDFKDTNVICVTHGHQEHYQDVPAVAKFSGATVVSSPTACKHLNSFYGLDNKKLITIEPYENKEVEGFKISAFLWLKAYVPRTENVIEALSFRSGSLFTGERIVQDQQRRICENKSAILTIKEHPLLGVGPGGPVHTKMCLDYKGGNFTRLAHNSYLFILADLGFLGFLPFLWFSVAYLVRGFFFGRKLQDPVLRCLVLGFTLSYIAVLISASAGGELMKSSAVAVIGVMLGINEVAMRLGQQTA